MIRGNIVLHAGPDDAVAPALPSGPPPKSSITLGRCAALVVDPEVAARRERIRRRVAAACRCSCTFPDSLPGRTIEEADAVAVVLAEMMLLSILERKSPGRVLRGDVVGGDAPGR